MPVTKSVDSL